MSRAVKVASASVTSGAFALSYTLLDSESIEHISITINTAPTSAGNITITLDSALGSQYDTLLRTYDPVSESLTNKFDEFKNRFVTGDKIIFAYANPDNRTVSAAIYHDLNPAQ